jgi:type II restriction/modification system DNA methylase subunit YeeA
MPVNTAALKTFAPAMRRQLLEAVGRKLDLLLHSQTPDTLSTYAKQIAELREQEAENREQLLERVAYTWFNRLCALRYLDARGWHPFGCKVLMPAGEGETQPELLKLMRAGSQPAELKPLTNEARLHGLLDGQIPTAIAGADPQGEVYRELVLASCRSYHQLLPELFEGLDDASELLLPDDLLGEGSIAGGFRNAISDEDCEDVEIIGWLYQFYISEKKDQVIGKVVKSEDIPAATQLFTPNWIVKYMVQNSLGATWLATYQESPLKGQMEFYIEPAEQTPEVQAQLEAITPESLDPEALTLIDPACGSGHILVEAYNLLKIIYLERGYRQRDIPELILTKNLYGLDICPRAVQLAAFSLLMKGREDDRRLLERGIQLNVKALQDSTDINVERLSASVDLSSVGISRADVSMLAEMFTHATTFGSLIQVPSLLAEKLPALRRAAELANPDLLSAKELQKLGVLVRQAEVLAQNFDAVVANPPYMGSKYMNTHVKQLARELYPRSKTDLYAISCERFLKFVRPSGFLALMTPFTWMFLKSYEQLRRLLLETRTLRSLIQPEYHAFFDSAYVPVSTFIFQSTDASGYVASFVRLTEFYGAELQPLKTLEAIQKSSCSWLYNACPDEFSKIPGSPIAYWVSDKLRDLFANTGTIGDKLTAKHGLSTGDNERYIRYWSEVSLKNIFFNCSSQQASLDSDLDWYPYFKGGAFRKWYGNGEHVLRYAKSGLLMEAESKLGILPGFRHDGKEYFFRVSGNWSNISSGALSMRYSPGYACFDQKGSGLFAENRETLRQAILYFNSVVARECLSHVCPTLDFSGGGISKIPFRLVPEKQNAIDALFTQLVDLAMQDWDAYERSWNFKGFPLITISAASLADRYNVWVTFNREAISVMKCLEEDSNRLFIAAYDLDGELAPELPIEQITLTVNPAYRYSSSITEDEQWERFRRDTMAELLSYATGCIMGRYSLDESGLILADSRESQAEQLSAYEARVGKPLREVKFQPDPDGIIPVPDGEWFEDDIVARTREFLAVTFPESSVSENLRFIEESLGKDIRKYFCSEFYKDHLQTYKKRPIYWMVQSPKKGFACLIYMHRYIKDTLNQVLNNYFRPYLQKLEARLAQLGLDQLNDSLPTRERTAARREAEKITRVLKECQTWEQDALLPLAQRRIELDLDDGVKVNYLKLQDVLAPIPGLAAKED